MRKALFALLVLAALAQGPSGAQEDGGPRSVKEIGDKPRPFRKKMQASPDWRDQSIYFVFPDRFWDGDPQNNHAGGSWFERSSGHGCHGGDFRGLAQKLDYIRDLGCTAIWITPIVQNWATYHGYAATNFLALDQHLGSLSDFRDFVDAAHKRNMYVIVDIVVNHEADLIYYKDGATQHHDAEREVDWAKNLKNDKCLPLPVEFQNLDWFHHHG